MKIIEYAGTMFLALIAFVVWSLAIVLLFAEIEWEKINNGFLISYAIIVIPNILAYGVIYKLNKFRGWSAFLMKLSLSKIIAIVLFCVGLWSAYLLKIPIAKIFAVILWDPSGIFLYCFIAIELLSFTIAYFLSRNKSFVVSLP